MYRLTTVIGSLVLFMTLGFSQVPEDFNTFNVETYRLYTEQKWDSLISMGNAGLRNDFDFYYLRMRLGIAYYTRKNYRKAATHFTRALGFNQDDPAAMEYLYYSRLLSGNRDQSDHVSKRFKGTLAQEVPPPSGRFLDMLSLEYAFQGGADDALFEDPFDFYPSSLPGEQYTTHNYSNFSISLTNRLAPGITLTHAYNLLYKSNHFYSTDTVNAIYSPAQRTIQHQYFISPRFTTRAGSVFIPALHLLRVGTQYYYDSGMGYMGGSSTYASAYYYKTDFITGIGFKQGMGRFDLHLGGWYGRLNGKEQVQNRLGITWYPLGNLNLYLGGFLNSQYQIIPLFDPEFRIIPEWLLGFGIAEKMWFEVEAELGEMTNYMEGNGMIVYNSFREVIEKKVRFSLSIPVSGKGSLLYVGGRWSASRSAFYPSDPLTSEPDNIINYNAFSIFGGLSWKF